MDPVWGLHCLTKRLLKHFSIRQKETTFVVIGALRVNMHIQPSMYSMCAYRSMPVYQVEYGILL